MRFLFHLVVATVTLAQPSLAWEKSKLLECRSKDYVALNEQGFLEPKDRRFWIDNISFTVDVESGVVAFAESKATPLLGRGFAKWRVVAEGDSNGDTVLAKSELPDRYIDDFIRIRDWKTRSEITFMFAQLDQILTGVCKPK